MQMFRNEVMDARREGWLGPISLAQPIRSWVWTMSIGVAALSLALLLVLGTYTSRSPVIGRLVPTHGMASVLAPASGFLSQLDTEEGEQVKVGQVLGVVSMPGATPANGDTVPALVHRLKVRRDGLEAAYRAQESIHQAQLRGLKSQLANTLDEAAHLDAEMSTRREQVRIANETLDRLSQLREGNYVSLLQVKQHQAGLLELIGATQALKRQDSALSKGVAQLQQAMQEVAGRRDVAYADHQRDLASLEQELVETVSRGSATLKASVTGVVAVQSVRPGQSVKAGQTLLTILPTIGTLEGELLVPSRAIGFVEVGDRVLLRYHAYPYQKFGHQRARVVSVSRSALSADQLSAMVGDVKVNEPHYRVTVALAQQGINAYGRIEPLKPGMLVEADILGDSRRLFEWLFEPLYSISQRYVDG